MTGVALNDLCRAVNGHLLGGDPSALLAGVSNNSKEIKPGEVFFALVANRDGHEFVQPAFAAGAAAAVVSRHIELSPGRGAVLVPDTLKALGDFGSWYRDLVDPTVVGITGSNGKTTTKEMTSHILSALKTVKSPCSFNNSLGVPLTLLNLKQNDTYAVAEIGTSGEGEIAHLASIAKPDIGVVLNVAPAHLDGLGNIKNVAIEKGCLIEALPADGCAILNADNHWCVEMTQRTSARVVFFGLKENADVRATDIHASASGVRFNALGTAFYLPMLGEHNVYNALAAIAVCVELGLDPAYIRDRLATFEAPPMRMKRTTIGEMQIINDAYNANFTSMEAALREFARLPVSGRRVMVCGDMLELGDQSEKMHAKIGQLAASSNIDVLVTVGSHALNIAKAAAEENMASAAIHSFKDVEAAAQAMPVLLERRDTMLLKGSRRVGLERLFEAVSNSDHNSDQGAPKLPAQTAAEVAYHTYRAAALQATP